MSDLNFTAEFGDALAEIKKLTQLSNQAAQALDAWKNATVKFDKESKGTVATVTAQISASQQLVATLVKEADAWTVRTTAIKASNQAAQDAAKYDKLVEQAARKRLANTVKQAREEQELIRKTNAEKIAAAQKAADDAAKAQAKIDAQNVAAARKQMQDDQRRANQAMIFAQMNARTEAERRRLQGINPNLDIRTQGQANLALQAQRVGTIGAGLGLGAAGVNKIAGQVQAGDFSGIEAKYAKLVQALVRYNDLLDRERQRTAKTLSGGGPGGAFPAPSNDNIQKLQGYLGLLNRIGGTLVNLGIYRTFNAIGHELTEAVTSARNFQVEVSMIRTLTQEAQQSNEQWAASIKKVSDRTGISLKDIGETVYEAASAQLGQGEELIKFAETAANLGKVTKASTQEAGKFLASVINSYKIPIEDAEKVAAKLFATIDRGTINVKDLSGSFGRVAFLAKDLGGDLDEVLAILATFTRSGISTAEAMTLLNNTMAQLTNPSETMKKALEDMGESSGRTAVANRGLLGTLQELIAMSRAGKYPLSDLFQGLRPERAASALSQSGKEIQKDLIAIRDNSQGKFANAVGIRNESDASNVNNKLNQLQNAVTASFGNGVVKLMSSVLDLTQSTENLEKKTQAFISTFVRGTVIVGGGITAYRLLRAGLEATAMWTGRNAEASRKAQQAQAALNNTVISGAKAQAQATQGSRLGNALRSDALASGATVAAMIGIGMWVDSLNSKLRTTIDYGNQLSDIFKQISSDKIKEATEKAAEKAEKTREEYEKSAKVLSAAVGDAIKQNNELLTETKTKIDLARDALKSGFVGVLDLAKNKVEEIESRLSKVRGILDGMGKEGVKFKSDNEDAVFGTLGKFAAPDQQLQLTGLDYQRASDKLRRLEAENNDDTIEERKDLFKKLAALTTQHFEQDYQQRFEAFKANGGQGFFYYDPQPQIDALRRLEAAESAYQARMRARLQEKQKLLEDESAKEKARVKQMQEAIDAFTNFNIFTPTGEVKKEFQGRDGKVDRNKVSSEVDRRRKDVEKFVPADLMGRLKLKEEADRMKGLYVEEARRVVLGSQLQKGQEGLVEAQKDANRGMAEGLERAKAYNAESVQLAQNLQVLGAALSETATNVPKLLMQGSADASWMGRNAGALGRGTDLLIQDLADKLGKGDSDKRARVLAGFTAAQEEAERLRSMSGEADKNMVDQNGVKVIDPNFNRKLLEQAQRAKQSARDAWDNAMKEYGLRGDPNGLFVTPDKKNLSDVDDLLNKLREKLVGTTGKLDESNSLLGQAKSQLLELRDLMDQVAKKPAEVQSAMVAGMGGLATTVKQSNIAPLEELSQKLDEVRKKAEALSQLKVDPIVQGQVDTAKKMAKDKFNPDFADIDQFDYHWDAQSQSYNKVPKRRAYGGPIGTDDQMIWAGGDEFVMNGGATRKFFSTISQMNNAGRVPQHFESGPTTNMGGVTFNINEAQQGRTTAKQVRQMMKRAQRMGSF